jgi:EcoEI R protein C-terminal
MSLKMNNCDTSGGRVVAADVCSQHEKQIATTDEKTSCKASRRAVQRVALVASLCRPGYQGDSEAVHPGTGRAGRTETGGGMDSQSRDERANRAKLEIQTHFDSKQQAFLDFVLAQYVKAGVHELDKEKLAPLLKLKYTAIADAFADLGKPEEFGQVFAGFQKYLYQKAV